VRFFIDGRVELGRRKLSDEVKRLLYKPYFARLDEARREIASIDPSFDPHGAGMNRFSWKTPILFLYRKLFGIYHIYPLKDLK